MTKPKKKKPRFEAQLDAMTRGEAIDYLTKRITHKFDEWMIGQTRPMDRFGIPGYYKHDVTRFADAILEKIPTYFD